MNALRPQRPGFAPLPAGGDAPGLGLLVRVHLLQAWRRIKSIREQSRLLSFLILVFVVGYAALAFWFFKVGLRFVSAFPGLGELLIERLMFLLFAFLFLLLIFSNLIISYTNLFRNRETGFLVTLPFPVVTVFQWKFLESTLLASWAFLFLIAPLLVAYGLHAGVAWHFYLVTPVLIGLFIVLPGALGAWAALIIARYLDRRSFQLLALGGAALVLVGAAYWLRAETITDDMLETRVLVVLDRLLVKTRFAQFAMLPSYWLSAGVLQWSEGALAGATFFALLLLSYALFFGYLTLTQTGTWFYGAFSAVQSRGSAFWKWGWFHAWESSRRALTFRISRLERALRFLSFLPLDVRALVAKDIRVFWRDTAQWGQTLVLFGLLAVYVINLRHFSQQLSHPFWVHVVSYLNLGACSLNLATLTTRFVFPQFSLEGKRLWIVGMAPMGLVQVLKVKYGLATAASLAVTLSLIVLSCQMLQMTALRTLFFAIAVGIMTFTLNGLAIGLGALYPNLKEDNPSKIVSGFGGTLCLVLSFLYIVVSVVLLAFGSPWPWGTGGGPDLAGVVTCMSGFLACSLAVGWLPYRWGVHQVRRFES